MYGHVNLKLSVTHFTTPLIYSLFIVAAISAEYLVISVDFFFTIV